MLQQKRLVFIFCSMLFGQMFCKDAGPKSREDDGRGSHAATKSGCPVEAELDTEFCYDEKGDRTELVDIQERVLLPNGTACVLDQESGDHGVVVCDGGQWILAAPGTATHTQHRKKRFFEIFFAVAAIGAIFAGSKKSKSSSSYVPPVNTVPTITCPNIPPIFYTGKVNDTMTVSWQLATAYDSQDGTIGVTQTQGKPPGSVHSAGVHVVTYMTKDSGGLSATCTRSFQVIVRRCPIEMSYLLSGVAECHPNTTKTIYGSRCNYTCNEGYQLIGASEAECWSNQTWSDQKPICQEISCPDPPEVENGEYVCGAPNFTYGTTCLLSCHDGYQADGSDVIRCESHAQIFYPGRCKDVEAPTLDCGPHVEIFSGPMLAGANVTWSEPNATDNSGLPVVVTSDIPPDTFFDVGRTDVTFTATDAENNTAQCTKIVNVTVKLCPDYVSPDNADVSCSHGYAYGSVCAVKCHQAFELREEWLEQACLENQTWSGQRPSCTARSCKDPPAVLHGKYSCQNAQRYQDSCYLECAPGFALVGPLTITCGVEIAWSQAGTCVDVQAPAFPNGCPLDMDVSAASLGEPTFVTYSLPEVVDNSDLGVITLGEPASGSAFELGSTAVTVTATDVQGNNGTCQFYVNVRSVLCNAPDIDRAQENLIAYHCPDKYVYGAVCSLSCTEGDPLKGPASIKCDKTNNSNSLTWTWKGAVMPHCVAPPCRKLTPPKNGALTCNEMGSFMKICFIACHENFTYPLTAPENYVCVMASGKWIPNNYVPGCTVRRLPGNTFTKPVFYYLTHECNSNSTTEMKEKFIQALNMSTFSDLCAGVADCSVTSVDVTCGPVSQDKKKRADFENKITATISLGEYKDQSSPEKTFAFYEDIAEAINDHFDRESNKGLFNIPEIGGYETMVYGDARFQCQDGTRIVSSSLSCAGCGPGHMFDNATLACRVCPIGTYQGQEVSFSCTACPNGTTTRQIRSTSLEQCQDLCPPGNFSATGLQPCEPCPPGTYQSEMGSRMCQSCPYGMSTSGPGITTVDECEFMDIRLNENSPGPLIQTHDPAPENLTYMTWIYADSPTTTTTFDFSLEHGSQTSYAVLALGQLTLYLEPREVGDDRKIRKWNHVAVVYTSGNSTLYLNGQQWSTSSNVNVTHINRLTFNFEGFEHLTSIVVSGFQLSLLTYSDLDIVNFATSCERKMDQNILAVNPMSGVQFLTPASCYASDNCIGDPCGRHGTCIVGPDNFTCVCEKLWSGDQCQIPPDFCEGNVCENGATCVNQPEMRNYSCVCAPGFKGSLCDGIIIHGNWSAWSEWSDCVTQQGGCGSGVSSQHRYCDSPRPDPQGNDCEGRHEETKPCNTSCRDCQWHDWSPWVCNASCGQGFATRYRSIAEDAIDGGRPCLGPVKHIKNCNMPPCPIDGGFGEWAEWDQCSRTCGGGVMIRSRACDNPPPSHGGVPCNSSLATQMDSCNNETCPECIDPELRPGHKAWNCTHDETGSSACQIVCQPGLVIVPPSNNTFQCGPASNYTWSHQTRKNPAGLLPDCTEQMLPTFFEPGINATFEIDCNKAPSATEMEEILKTQLASANCTVNETCDYQITLTDSCSRRKKRTTDTYEKVKFQISIKMVGYKISRPQYLSTLPEQDAAFATEKIALIENKILQLVNDSDKIFSLAINGMTYKGDIDNVQAKVACQNGAGFYTELCVDCPAGSYSAGNGSCLLCAKGYFQDLPRMKTCKRCPGGTSTSGEGSYLPGHCVTNPVTFEDVYPDWTTGDQLRPKSREKSNFTQKYSKVADSSNMLLTFGVIALTAAVGIFMGAMITVIIKKYYKELLKAEQMDNIPMKEKLCSEKYSKYIE